MNRFGEFANEKALDGEKMRIDDAVGHEVTVLAYQTSRSRYGSDNGMYVKIQIMMGGKKRIIFTGSGILMRQCQEYADKIPFIATIVKPDKYYSFS